MRILLLGTGGYFPNDRRHTACVMLPELGAVFDAGTALFRACRHLQTRELDVFLTHAHLDHIVGLTTLLVPLVRGELARIRVHGDPGTLAAVQEHLFAQSVFPLHPEFQYVELAREVPVGQGGWLTHVRLKSHPGGSIGYRIDWPDRALAYITDTTVDGSYTEFLRGVDVLLHECYFADEMAEWAAKTGHSHTSQVAALARGANVGRLVLMHVDPLQPTDDCIGLEKARGVFPATVIGCDGDEIEF